jgi:hypothetical protein
MLVVIQLEITMARFRFINLLKPPNRRFVPNNFYYTARAPYIPMFLFGCRIYAFIAGIYLKSRPFQRAPLPVVSPVLRLEAIPFGNISRPAIDHPAFPEMSADPRKKL